jgi:tRNA-2-methylthio-N6-dimethylallyladenosine synthase
MDDVSDEEKGRRVNQITTVQHGISLGLNLQTVGVTERVLIDGESKKSSGEWFARTDTSKVVVFPKSGERIGDYVDVVINGANSATLFGTRVHSEDAIEAAA